MSAFESYDQHLRYKGRSRLQQELLSASLPRLSLHPARFT
jgi:hypothetical protein